VEEKERSGGCFFGGGERSCVFTAAETVDFTASVFAMWSSSFDGEMGKKRKRRKKCK
jgi:hypothetical protein